MAYSVFVDPTEIYMFGGGYVQVSGDPDDSLLFINCMYLSGGSLKWNLISEQKGTGADYYYGKIMRYIEDSQKCLVTIA